jgi:hypothetical protein
MAKLKRIIKIQKLCVFIMGLIAEKFGVSPKKLPPLPKQANIIPIKTEHVPIKNRICRQSNQ